MRKQPRNTNAFLGVVASFFCIRSLSRGQAAERLPRSAERGILPAPAGACERGRSQRGGGVARENKRLGILGKADNHSRPDTRAVERRHGFGSAERSRECVVCFFILMKSERRMRDKSVQLAVGGL